MTEFLNSTDKQLHDHIHEYMLQQHPSELLKNNRLKIIKKLQPKLNIKGYVADIGCGSGYFSIGLAQQCKDVSKIDAIEASKLAVEQVIPRNIHYYNMGDTIRPVHADFESLEKNKYDIVFSMGAIHHAQNLRKVFGSIFESLKPEGLLIAQEPAMPDRTTHLDYQSKYSIVEERFGIKIQNSDRFDRFFRECEYKSDAIRSGFDIVLWEDFKTSLYARTRMRIGKIRKQLSWTKMPDATWRIQMNHATKHVQPKLLVAKKIKAGEVIHHVD